MKTIFSLAFLMLISSALFSQTSESKVISYKTECQLENKKSLLKKVSVVIQINNRKDEYLTHVSIYFKKNEPILFLSALLKDKNGEIIRKLKDKDISEVNAVSNSSLYSDMFVKKFQLKHNEYPYQLHYSYAIRKKNFFTIAGWSPTFFYKTPTDSAELKVIIPNNYKIRTYLHNVDNPSITKKGNQTIYVWKSSYTKILKNESYAPPLRELYKSVSVLPEEFHYGIDGKYDSWKSFGDWQYHLNEGLDILTDSEKIKITQLIQGIDNDKEKAKILYNYLQDNTRYINVSIDIGGLQTYPAEYVCNNKFGDCKALSNYLMAVLKFANIKAYYSLIQSGKNPVILKDNEIQDLTDHIILFVPFEKDTVWLECTSSLNAFGYLGSHTQNRNALIIEKNNSHLVKTPALSTEDVKCYGKTVFDIDFTSQASSVNTEYTLRGKNYDYTNYYKSDCEKDDFRSILRHQILSFKDIEIKKWKFYIKDRNIPESYLSAEFILPNYVKSYGDMIYFSLIKLPEIPKIEKPKNRKLPVRINVPINRIDTFIYKNISSLKLKDCKNIDIKTKFGIYKLNYKITGNNLEVIRNFVLFAGNYKLEEYQEFYNFIHRIRKIEKRTKIIFEKN